MKCETKVLNKEYSDRVLDLAKKIVAKESLDTVTNLCRKDYLVAKRYKNILSYLAGDVCCPTNVKDAIIEKLQLNGKF